jgi:hypothetical protein
MSKSKKTNVQRAVVVVDRGWIFAGDVTETDDRVHFDNAVHVFRWSSIGFPAVIEDPHRSEVDIRKLAYRVDIPKASEIFRIPVPADWGTK